MMVFWCVQLMKMSFMNVFDNDGKPVSFVTNTQEYGTSSVNGPLLSPSEALVTYPEQGGKEQSHLLIDCYQSIKRQSLKISAGVMFKF